MSLEHKPFAEDMLVNPYYAVEFADYLFRDHEPECAKEDWVLLNAELIDDIGIKSWLEELLSCVVLPAGKYDGHDVIIPTLAVRISARLQGRHSPLVTQDLWLQANTKLVKELGPSEWLTRFLEVMETGGPPAYQNMHSR